jgi:hypothetical protein
VRFSINPLGLGLHGPGPRGGGTRLVLPPAVEVGKPGRPGDRNILPSLFGERQKLRDELVAFSGRTAMIT